MGPNLDQKLKLLPDKPGVYLMQGEGGKVIYVGKAISLKNRVRSYFQNTAGHTAKVKAMVARIVDLEYIITDSEVEALILECNLIKRYRPNYNVRLRDDKHYPYLKVTVNEVFPRVLITRSIKKDGARYYGPFTSSGAVQETLKLLKKLFPLRSCKRQNLATGARPCLNHHIKRCLAPCAGIIEKEHYANLVKEVCLFLEGRHETLIKTMEQQMLQAAEEMQFERAAEIRDQIKALEKVAERQKIVSSDLADQDVIAMARGFDEVCVMVFFIRSGKLLGREPHFLQGTDDLSRSEVITAFVKQYYSQVEFIPKEILLDEEAGEGDIITQWLKQKRGGKVTIHVPRRGAKKELVDMVAKNALQELEQHNAQFFHDLP
ncbi:MAG: excinuclease ABC subunit UvrC, partial [Firmicutes bacterium]|nr:excinuclease ABC subunit UvrC [Bacillota bacterium]